MNHYDEFRKQNKVIRADGSKATIIAVSLKRGVCIAETRDGSTRNLVPIELLISDMENNIVHINDFKKLKGWRGFEDEDTVFRMKSAYYPEDYFENTGKYVVNVTGVKDFRQKFQIDGANVRFNYNESLRA